MSYEKLPLLLITTSSRKFAHIDYLGGLNDIDVFWVNREYEEIQDNDLEFLMRNAIKEAPRLDVFRDTFFILEQTSVFFDAYDESGRGPGQYFKNWWQTKSDEELKLIISKDPGAVVESGLALNIPGHEPLVFTNTQEGSVSFDGEIIPENEQYPWLNAEDFSLYFVPDGATKVYTEMDIREFLKYDFRKPNFDKITKRVDEYSAILKEELSMGRVWDKAMRYGEKGQRGSTSYPDTKQSTLEENYQ